ncbi:maleylpyruvate isomerase N-terminal domain-containing protein [Microvirga sp. STR05]|uniref:Maleylpyruvate isomerase N-terminal domain-containing protein n=1 Tax=Hymenobacter duratus TaxID=2771356 RepID=A0ABR8JPQ3_9BACT|nr:maleylpyruvate isomerase N-terminal domain-containing protein [Hymenobacter duratus]MBD2716774.1 maleylpyruvate isomerase N-terminal domain-containing protein [Hymenobacter duratus]MBR7951689.1 maleylpyruvate isomerase N-terminal domain-containing protein [Microvirga sp. STR05]
MQPLPVLSTAPLFPILDAHLLALLRALDPADWERPTLAPQWRVRDVALHLLDGSLRTLSVLRDGHFGAGSPASPAYADVVSYLNQVNQEWVLAGQRLSPTLITWLLELSGPAYNAYISSLPPHAPAVFPVAWAGEQTSLNWFHVAREYTEKWHHQQQIRQAVGQEAPLLTAALYHPFLSTCLRALPHHYRNVEAAAGTVVQLMISGAGGGTWYLRRTAAGWELGTDYTGAVATSITLAGEVAWRLFTKSLPRQLAAGYLQATGQTELAEPLYSLVTVMA